MSWHMRPVNELCELAVDCVNKTAPVVEYETDYKMIRTTNVKNGFIDLDEVRYVTEEVFQKWTRRSKPQYGDVILTREAPVGEVGRFTSDDDKVFLGQRLFHYRPKPEKLDWNFLAYVLQSPPVQGRFKGMGFGATVDHVRVGDAERLPIPCPPLDVQKRIGGILSAYDDLIENNRRRIQLLEQSARLLYKEWFVHLRFPGHEHVKIKDGVPEVWEKVTYGDLFDFLGGFPFKSKTYQEDGAYGIVTIKNVHNATFVSECSSFLDKLPEKMKEYCLLKTGDVLLSLTGNVGRACIVFGENYLLNQRVAKIVGKSGIPCSYVYWTFSNEDTQKQLENLSYGVAQLNLSPVNLSAREFIKPSATLLNLFSEMTEPVFKQICILNLQTQRLKKARDLLLPRLMNEEIAV